ALQGAVESRGLLKAVRPRHRLNEDGLPLHIATRKVELSAIARPHEIEVQARGGRRRRALRREDGLERQRRAAAARRELPIGRHVLRSERDRLETDILQTPL